MEGKLVNTNNNSGNFKYKINQLACMGICVWFTSPYLRNRVSYFGFFVVFGLWVLSIDLKWLTKKWSKDMVGVVLFFATFIPYLVSGALGYGIYGPNAIFVSMSLFFLGLFVNDYYVCYKKDYNTLGKIALISLIMFIVGSFQTYSGLLRYPTASRGLAGGVYVTNPALALQYKQLGIGGFGYIYAACGVLIAAVYFVVRKGPGISWKYKAISFVSIAAMSLMLVKASYATALLLLAVGIVSIFVVKNRKSLVVFMLFSAFFLFVFPQELVGEVLLKAANLFADNLTLYKRFVQVAMSFFPDSSGIESLGRTRLYMSSLTTFLKHPLFGAYGPFGGNEDVFSYSVVGGHSGLLDLLAFYGLFTGIPLFGIFYSNMKKQLQIFKNSKYEGLILITSIIFFVMGILNPNITVHEIGFAQFCVVPAIPFLAHAFTPNTEKPEWLRT